MESSICKNLLSKIHNNEKYVLNNIYKSWRRILFLFNNYLEKDIERLYI